jgi:hypothetical protein
MKTTLLSFLLMISSFVIAQQTDVLQPNGAMGKDAWIWSFPNGANVNFGEANAQNGGLHNVIRAETWQWQQGRFDTIRGLIHFDLSHINSASQIVSASLNLYYFRNPNFTQQVGENAAVIESINQNWNETQVTWNNQPTTDTNKRVFLAKSTSLTQNYLNIDVTELVRQQLQNNLQGWMIKMQTETGFNGLTFASSDNTDETLRPKLSITYMPANSVRSFVSQQAVKIFPNPASSSITIQHLASYTINKIELKDIAGKTVLAENNINQNTTNSYTLTTTDLAKGVYFVSINGGEITRKVVVSN